jgi:hypothetical protein
MSELSGDLVPLVPSKLRTFLALNGSRVKFSLVAGRVTRYECLKRRKNKDGKKVERLEHSIWMLLADGREECLRLKKFEGEVSVGQSLILALGSNQERVECVALQNRSIGKIFYRREVWHKLLETGCLIPILFTLFIFPLLWLVFATFFFRANLSTKAVLISPIMALGISVVAYLLVTLPVKILFRRHINAILQK